MPRLMQGTGITMGRFSLSKICQRPLSNQVITALKENNVELLEALRKAGKCFNGHDTNGNTLLHLAIQREVTSDVFEYVVALDSIPMDSRNLDKCTPLMEAFGCRNNGEDFALMLIENGCKIQVTYPDGNTPLHLAVYNKWFHVAELLIERGMDVDCQNSEQETPLHIAGRVGSIEIAWMLLFFGADPNITYMTHGHFHCYSYTIFTFFDIITSARVSKELREVFFDQSCAYDKCFSLQTVAHLMEQGENEFYNLIECICDINYTYDDLCVFSKNLYKFNADMFRKFIDKFSYVVQDICVNELFFCGDPVWNNFSKNMFTLIGSDAIDSLVEQINNSSLPLLLHLVQSFTLHRESLEDLTGILCGLLSFGAILTANVVNEVYFSFGQCKLLEILLHMDIQKINECEHNKYILPRILYDMAVEPNSIYLEPVCDDPIIFDISEFFTLSQLRKTVDEFPVPTLVELARNVARQYIIHKFNTKNSMQFYTILRKLPIAEHHKKIISFETPLFLIE